MEKSAGKDEIDNAHGEGEEGQIPRKRTRADIDGGAPSGPAAGLCDDVVVGNIFARLPARTAVACTALSKHHRRLIRTPEFGILHCRLGALPRPHVAYLATAPIKRRPEQAKPVSVFHGFHVAGAGLSSGGDAPMRALTGSRYLGTTTYVGTCNGVLLLAPEKFSATCRCTLWNPAVADVSREVTVRRPSPVSECLVLGLGYGPRSKTYKLLLVRKDSHPIDMYREVGGRRFRLSGGPTHRIEYSLVIHSLGGDAEKQAPPLRTVLSEGVVDERIKHGSLYIDGTIYLLQLEESAILAFDVDDETVTKISLPGEERQEDHRLLDGRFKLIEMSGRPCLVTIDGCCIALWILTADHQWDRKCAILNDLNIYCRSIVGVWDCGGVLVLYFEQSTDKLWLYDVAKKMIFKAHLPKELTVERSDYEISWGYKPTLVSPGSIVAGISKDLERRRNRSASITEVVNPLGKLDRRKGEEATLNTVCLMEFLVRIMQKLPDDMDDVVEMPTMDSEDSDYLFGSYECSDECSD